MSCGVALEAEADLGVGLLLGASSNEVTLGRLVVVDHAPVHDGVQGPVESPVAESVEPMAFDSSGGRFQRADPGQRGEGGLRAAPTGVRPGDDEVCGADSAHARLGHQGRHHRGDEVP